jgi:hypothetical protein
MRMSSALSVVAVVAWMSGAVAPVAGAQSDTSVWNDARARAVVELATKRRSQQLADTLLADYQALAHGHVELKLQLGATAIELPSGVKLDEIVSEVYWQAPNRSKQRIIGRRDTTLLPTDVRYHVDHLGIVQNNFPDFIRLGEGDELKDVPHPLSAIGLREYDFQIGDTVTIRLQTAGGPQTITTVAVRVRPKNEHQPRVIGAVFIAPADGQVVRMALSFTAAAFIDRSLEYVAVSLTNNLHDLRFWLPSLQEIEIRRKAVEFNMPIRMIIKGAWKISDYRFNLALPRTMFVGPEYTTAPASVLRAYKWPTADILDSLPSTVSPMTTAAIREVEEQVRSLVTPAALARAASPRLSLSMPGASQFARVNRVEGLAVGAGFSRLVATATVANVLARYGLDDGTVKGEAGLTVSTPTRTEFNLSFSREYRDVSDVQERSTAMNSLAAQEFGSDYTDPIDVMGGAARFRWRPSDLLMFGASASVERQRALAVNASPITGTYSPTLAADALNAIRFSLTAERPLSVWSGNTQIGGKAELRVQQSEWRDSTFRNSTTRLFVTTEWVRPIKLGKLRSWNAFAMVGPDSIPPQEMVYFGGPVSAPGYPYHALRGKWGYAHRVEWKVPVPFPRIPLGRFGATPGRATLVPYGSVAAINVGLCAPAGAEPIACGTWIRPSVGLGLFTFYDVIRFDVAMGLAKQGRFMFGFDIAKEFWSIL